MAFDLDGLAVLASMATQPDTFAGIESEAAKIARTLLTKLLKNKATTLPLVRSMASALPAGTLAHVTDGMSDSEITALAVRFDRLNPTLKAGDRQTRAILVGDLISGAAEPATKTAGGKKTSTSKSSAAQKPPSSGVEAAMKVLNSKAMGARKAAKATRA